MSQIRGARPILIVVAALLGACTAQNPAPTPPIELASPTASSATASPSPQTLQPTVGPTAPPEPTAVMERVGWTLDGAVPIDAQTTQLQVLAAHAGCGLKADTVGPLLPPHITYRETQIVIVLEGIVGFKDGCRSVDPITVPAIIALDQPIGDRQLVDASYDPPSIRWRSPPADAIPLATWVTEPRPIGAPFGPMMCAGIGRTGTLTGAPDDLRLVWVDPDHGDNWPRTRWLWPPGFKVVFLDGGFDVLDESNAVVHREGEPVDGACVASDSALSLYSTGYLVVK